jgi:hypothetical protein
LLCKYRNFVGLHTTNFYQITNGRFGFFRVASPIIENIMIGRNVSKALVVTKILQGGNAANIPVEQPTRFDSSCQP